MEFNTWYISYSQYLAWPPFRIEKLLEMALTTLGIQMWKASAYPLATSSSPSSSGGIGIGELGMPKPTGSVGRELVILLCGLSQMGMSLQLLFPSHVNTNGNIWFCSPEIYPNKNTYFEPMAKVAAFPINKHDALAHLGNLIRE